MLTLQKQSIKLDDNDIMLFENPFLNAVMFLQKGRHPEICTDTELLNLFYSLFDDGECGASDKAG